MWKLKALTSDESMELDDDEASGSKMDMCTNGSEETSNRRPVKSGEALNIEAYAALYKGRTKIMRLLFIANHCGENCTIQLEALRLAYDEIKKGDNTTLFRNVVDKINGRLGDKYGMDSAWCEAVRSVALMKEEKLDDELTSYEELESIRMGYSDCGDFYYACGLLEVAFQNYIEALDYCEIADHFISPCMKTILVSIEMGQFNHVTSYVNKAEQTFSEPVDPILVAKLRCASGLAHLELKEYKLAACKFLEVNPELGNSYNEVIAPQDVATYAGLCALASFDRSELKQKVIDNIGFRKFLDLVREVRELINDFDSSRYVSCLEYLESLKANLLLDIHLHDHVETLCDQIRKKALIQYTLSVVHVDLSEMADAFKTSVSGLEKELGELMTDNQIQARTDLQNKILMHVDQRNATTQISPQQHVMSEKIVPQKHVMSEKIVPQQHVMSEKIVLKSSDDEIFEVDEATALQLKTVANLVKDNHVKQAVTLANVEGKILSKVIEYCKKHVNADSSSSDETTTDNNLKKWDAEFMKVDQSMIFRIMMAAHDLKIQSLVDLTCQTVANMIRGKTTAEMIAIFDIPKEDLVPEEEAEKIRKENQWAFE